jgi:hypothetical protein
MQRDPQKVADQIVRYADSATAVSFAQSVVFALELGGKDFAQHVSDAGYLVPLISMLALGAYLSVVLACWHVEKTLYSDPLPRDPSEADRAAKHMMVGRIAIVVLATAITLLAWKCTVKGVEAEKNRPAAASCCCAAQSN